MSNDLVQTTFESTLTDLPECYIGLSPETVASLEQDAKDISDIANHASFEIGAKLVSAQSKYRHNKHGGFEGWIELRLKGFGRRTAYNIISRYEQFSTVQNFAQLDIALSAQYQLSAPSTPQEAREEAIQLAEDGTKITLSIAENLIEKHKQAQKQAEEESRKAREETQLIQQTLSKMQQEFEATKHALVSEQVREIVREIKVIPPDYTDLQKQVKQLAYERDNEAARAETFAKKFQENLSTQKEDEAKERMRQRWRSASNEFQSMLTRWYAQWPTTLDIQSFEPEDWARLENAQKRAQRFIEDCQTLRRDNGLVVEAG